MRPEAAMIFAAGFGTRLLPLTELVPKPLLEVDGQPMIDHAIELLRGAGIKRIVVNTHHLAHQIEDHLSGAKDVHCLRESPEILETGGGLRNALPLLGGGPVITANCDVLWSGENPVQLLLDAWRPDRMEGLMAMVPTSLARGYSGMGDFFGEPDEVLRRRGKAASAPLVYGGLQILRTEGLSGFPQSSFSVSLLWDKMIARRRLFGATHQGGWTDVGNPEGLRLARTTSQATGDV